MATPKFLVETSTSVNKLYDQNQSSVKTIENRRIRPAETNMSNEYAAGTIGGTIMGQNQHLRIFSSEDVYLLKGFIFPIELLIG